MYPLQENFGKGPASKIPRQHHETVSKILNNIVGIGCEVVKTADPSAANPWKIVIDLSAIQGGASLPNQNETTAGKFLKSTGASGAEVWDGVSGVVPEGGNVGDVLTNNGGGASFWSPPAPALPEGGNVGDVLTREGDGTAWLPPVDGLPAHDVATALKTLRSTGATAPVWDWIRPDQLQTVGSPADDFHLPLATAINTSDGRPYFVSATPARVVGAYVPSSHGGGIAQPGQWLRLWNVNGQLEARWQTATVVFNGGALAGDVAVWSDPTVLVGDSLANLLRTKIASPSAGRPTYLRQDAAGTIVWEDLCENTPTNDRLAVWKVNGNDFRLHSSDVDAAAIATVAAALANGASGDMLYHNGGAWVKLSSSGKSQYMVLQLDANRRPQWDFLRAY